MKYLLFILIFCLPVSSANAQNIKGQITDASGEPLNAVTIFVAENREGLMSNREGRFQIGLREGDYTFYYKLPGYKESVHYISVQNEDSIFLQVTLEKDLLQKDDIDKKQSENYADSIISNCIESAQKHYNAVKYYKAGNYINGMLVLKNVSDFVDKASYKIDKSHVSEIKDRIISQEIYNEIEYFFPETYKMRVEGNLGYIPENFTDRGAINILKGSIYTDTFCGFISPFMSSAFRYYKFGYEGYYKSSDTKCHIVKVRPKKNDPKLFHGYLYIKDVVWSIDHVILKINKQGVRAKTTITYFEIEDGASLPVAYHNDIRFEIMGTGGTVCYYSGLKYNEVSGELMPQEEYAADEENKSIGRNAYNRDNAYWNRIRMHPIDKDSVIYMSDNDGFKRIKTSFSKSLIGKMIVGGYIAGDEQQHFSVKYNGVKMIFRDYNYVDGFWLGNKFDIRKKFDSGTSIEVSPYVYYLTARKRIAGGGEIIYNYNRRKKGQTILSLGSRSEDFNNLSITRYQNYFNSLILGENENFFYQRDFVSATNNIHLNKKIRFSASLGVERRRGLSNHTDFNILGRNNIKPNIFSNDRFDRTYFSVGFSYSPRSNYSITEALDMHRHNVTPVFNIEYQEGFSSWQINNSTYKKIKGGISHNIQLDAFNSIDYKIESGVFFDKGKRMHFTDYQHFGASDMLLNLNSLFDSFLLLDNYELQTNKYWVNLFLNYSGRYVLLKFIPFLQDKPFTENLHLKTLFTPETKSYVETGYSISFNRYFGAGVFTSFHNIQGRKVGFRLSLNLRSLNFM